MYSSSLAMTIDSVEETFFYGKSVPAALREQVARWIADRQGKPGAYANMFAPTSLDVSNGIRLFTGEVVRSGAALRHVSGEEACRSLLLLKSRSTTVKAALERATAGMLGSLERCRSQRRNLFCCGTCDPALWRHVVAGGLMGEEDWLSHGMKALKACRDSQGKWRRFPFFTPCWHCLKLTFPQLQGR